MIKHKLIYFDNSATSYYKPKSVQRAFLKALKSSANPGRSGHKLSIKNSVEIWKTRQVLANHFNIKEAQNVIFTKNCTEALNIAIFGLLQKDSYPNKTKKHVICSCFDHNSILRPLNYLKETNQIELTILTPKNNLFITSNDLQKKVKSNTYLICMTHISNVIGHENDIKSIGLLCQQKNILFLLDCAQSVGHKEIDMQKYNINFLTFSGHKGFLSPQGVGGLVINSKIIPKPLMMGGTGTDSNNLSQPTDLPESLESGTLMTPNILALKQGAIYVEKHFEKNSKKTKQLTNYLFKHLTPLEKNNQIKIYTNKQFLNGVVSINIFNLDSSQVADFLDQKYNIAVRAGLHCAPLTHKFLSTTEQGTIRVSLSFKNTFHEIDIFIKALKKIISQNILN